MKVIRARGLRESGHERLDSAAPARCGEATVREQCANSGGPMTPPPHGARGREPARRRRGAAPLPRVLRAGLHFGDARPAAVRCWIARRAGLRRRGAAARALRRPAEPLLLPHRAGRALGRGGRRRVATTRSSSRRCCSGCARRSTTRRGRCCGRARASRVASSSSTGGVLRMNALRSPRPAGRADRREPVRHPRGAQDPGGRVHRRGADAGGDLRGAAAAAGQPRLRRASTAAPRSSQGAALPRVPARAAAPHRAARPLTPARHLALDAVINAIIHRAAGRAYSSLMRRYYARRRAWRSCCGR